MILGGLDRTQKEVSLLLDELTRSSSFPEAVLFAGEGFSGRMFAATQVTKALGIPSENTLIVSDRNHAYRIRTALRLYEKNRNNSARAFLRDCASVLLQQYHGALIEGQNTQAGKKKFSDAAEVTDMLRDLDSVREADVPDMCQRLEKALSPLMDSNRTSAISIGQVRAIRDWCATSSMDGAPKAVIIEGLENASDSAVNGLLKTLEEPPAGSYFILISSNPGRIPATIMSRVRRFAFKSLSKDDLKYILGQLFVDPSKYDSLEEFFLEGSGIDDRMLQTEASNLIEGREMDMKALVQELEKNQGWDRFFSHVLDALQKAFNEGRLEERRARYLLDAVNSAVLKGRTFNQMKRLTFEYVVYRVREVIR